MEEKNISCSYPWYSFTIANGYYNLCCSAKQSPVSLSSTGLYDFFYNSDYMKEVRNTMLQNKWHPDCSLCKEQEELGLQSLRLKTSPIPNTEPELTYLDLRLSNKCNLGCRMCSEDFSSVIAEEKGIKKTYDWSEHALKQIKKITTLKKIYITGGEPLLVKENYKLLEYLIEKNLARGISLTLNTNCTVLPNKFVDLCLQFQEVWVNLSIDGIGKVQEYIRWPSKWETIENVFHTWVKLATLNKKIKLNLCPVIQLLNAPYLDEYLDYFSQYSEVNLAPIILDMPNYFDLAHSPQEVWNLIDKQKINNTEIKDMIEKKKHARVEDFWFDHGKNFLKKQDKMRKINLEDYEPYFGFLK